jgi:hypothetical protein
MRISNLVLCSSIILGSASAALAAGPYGSSAELRQCIANLQASGHSFGGDPDTTGMTAYDSMVGRCMDQIWYRQSR